MDVPVRVSLRATRDGNHLTTQPYGVTRTKRNNTGSEAGRSALPKPPQKLNSRRNRKTPRAQSGPVDRGLAVTASDRHFMALVVIARKSR
jgi:hypothetical protein